jgi:hypothetical protein
MLGAHHSNWKECEMRLFDTIRQDGQHAIRILLQNPGFALIAILSLALGIGANTAIFTLIDTVLLRGRSDGCFET